MFNRKLKRMLGETITEYFKAMVSLRLANKTIDELEDERDKLRDKSNHYEFQHKKLEREVDSLSAAAIHAATAEPDPCPNCGHQE